MLWPAGYLLATWVSDTQEQTGWGQLGTKRHGAPRVIDLGTGTGAVAIAAALSSDASVVATDEANRSLALATANAALSGAQLSVFRFDWEEPSLIEQAAAMGPFDLVTGAALQFERWEVGVHAFMHTLHICHAKAAESLSGAYMQSMPRSLQLHHVPMATTSPSLHTGELMERA